MKLKNTLKGLVAVAAISFLQFNNVLAQDKPENGHVTRLSGALSLGVPTKSYMGDVVIAPDLRLQHDLGERISLTLTTGYYGFIGKENNALANQINSDLIPLKAGMKFFFGDTFYLQPEVGVSFATKKNYGNPFTYAPSLGYANNKWDFALRYEGFKYENRSNGMVTLRAAYAFKRPNN
jgi:hypothetical protein